MVFLGNPESGVELHPIDFAAFAHPCGGIGLTVEDPAECASVVEQFLGAPDRAILQAVVDQLEPPPPSKVTGDQGLHFGESLARGEPHRADPGIGEKWRNRDYRPPAERRFRAQRRGKPRKDSAPEAG
jgi:pyruvate dehydrogenase (quinone)